MTNFDEQTATKIKEALSKQIEEQIKVFLKNGGKIDKRAYGETMDPITRKYLQREPQSIEGLEELEKKEAQAGSKRLGELTRKVPFLIGSSAKESDTNDSP